MTYYVLMMHDGPTAPGAHLTTVPTLAEAAQSVRWQGASFPSDLYPVCTYDPTSGKFLEVHNRRRLITLGRGPYTLQAFEEFKASLPKA